MLGDLDLLPWPVQLGIVAFLITVIITLVVRRERAISKGDLIPRATHERELKRADDRAADYKELWQISDKRGDVMEAVAGDIVVIGENLDKLLKSIPTPQEGRSS